MSNKIKTEDIIKSLRICAQGNPDACAACAYSGTDTCYEELCEDAADMMELLNTFGKTQSAKLLGKINALETENELLRGALASCGVPENAGGAGAERGGWADGWCKAIDAAISLLEKAPTVEPEPQWIPVTKRLPEENQPVCILLENGNVFRAEIRIRQLLKEWWYRYDPTDEDMDMLGIHYEVEGWLKENPIVAWMPLPEYTPAGEETEHGTTE